MLRPAGYLILLILTTSFPIQAADNPRQLERLKNAVVKIYTTTASPDYFTPWRMLTPQQSSGSGAVIDNNRILTNAHVVANASYLQAQRNGDPRKYQARVIFVSHEADLALIQVDEPGFYDGIKPLSVGKLPEPLEEVSVFGYPFGGVSLSITKGILSRVEHQYYSHAGSYLLAGQLDAAINPGNSGGPVIVGGKIAGVVMQANTSNRAENLGYFVPPSVIRHVLKDAEDNNNDGFPELGFRTQNMESPAMKSSYGLKPNQSGALVAKVFNRSPADKIILENDVILKIDGFNVADDRSIEFRPNLRTNFKYAIDQYHVGDTVDVKLVRDGKIKNVKIKAGKRRNSYSLVQNERFDSLPRYFIYGGVVFVPLNMNLIKRWGSNWHSKAPVDFLHARNRWSSDRQQELVVALKVLAADVNLGYHDWKNWVIDNVNGQPVKNFEHFCDILRNNQTPHITLKDDDGYQMVLDHQQALDSAEDILRTYRIPSSHSPLLFARQP